MPERGRGGIIPSYCSSLFSSTLPGKSASLVADQVTADQSSDDSQDENQAWKRMGTL